MSEEFHIHGPHDHELEHAAEHGAGDSFASRIAVTTAILATLGAMFAYMAGATQAEAQMDKNTAAIRKTDAADQWNFYQAKSNRQTLSQLAAEIVPADRSARFRDDMKRYEAEKQPIKEHAEALDREAERFSEDSDHLMHIHHTWAKATTMMQIAIALSAIALLTRRQWLQWLVFGFGGLGCLAAVLGLMGIAV